MLQKYSKIRAVRPQPFRADRQTHCNDEATCIYAFRHFAIASTEGNINNSHIFVSVKVAELASEL